MKRYEGLLLIAFTKKTSHNLSRQEIEQIKQEIPAQQIPAVTVQSSPAPAESKPVESVPAAPPPAVPGL